MSSVDTGQMSVVATVQMSAAGAGQMSTLRSRMRNPYPYLHRFTKDLQMFYQMRTFSFFGKSCAPKGRIVLISGVEERLQASVSAHWIFYTPGIWHPCFWGTVRQWSVSRGPMRPHELGFPLQARGTSIASLLYSRV